MRSSLDRMPDGVQGHGDSAGLHELLARPAPDTPRTVLQIGRGDGWIAPSLQRRDPAPVVYGADSPDSEAAETDRLDGYEQVDLDRDVPALDPGSVDCIVYADVLPRIVDPLAALERHRALLSGSGTVVCSIPNLQHQSVVSGILRGVFPYIAGTLLDPSYLRLFTSASIMQLLLDAGYAPDTVARIEDPGATAVADAG